MSDGVVEVVLPHKTVALVHVADTDQAGGPADAALKVPLEWGVDPVPSR